MLNDVETLLRDTEALVEQWGFPYMAEAKREITLHLPNGVIEGDISFFETDELAGFASLHGVDHLRSRAAILLLVLAAQETPKHSVIVFGYDDKANEIKVNSVFFEEKLTKEDAQRRLVGLIDAVQISRTVPAVEFGNTVKTINNSIKPGEAKESPESAFGKFVASDEYGKSIERRLFGEEPEYSVVFKSDGPIMKFWNTLKSAVDGPKFKSSSKHGVTSIKVSGYIIK